MKPISRLVGSPDIDAVAAARASNTHSSGVEPVTNPGVPTTSPASSAASSTARDWPFRAPTRLEEGASTTSDAELTFAVVIAAYNVGPFIAEAIESVLGQTRPPEQVIVVDDGSTDETPEQIARFGNSVRLITQENGGEGAAKNAGWRAATTDFVVFLDGDDRFTPERIEAMHWLATKRRDLDVLVTDLVEFGPGARVVPPMSAEFVERDPLGAVLDHCTIYVPGVRRCLLERVGGMREVAEIHRDWELAVRLVLAGGRVGVIGHPLYEYRRWAGQITADELRVIDMDLQTLDAIAGFDALTGPQRATVRANARTVRVRQWRVARQTDSEYGFRSEHLAAHLIVHTPEYPLDLRLRAQVTLLAPRLARRVAALRRRAKRVQAFR